MIETRSTGSQETSLQYGDTARRDRLAETARHAAASFKKYDATRGVIFSLNSNATIICSKTALIRAIAQRSPHSPMLLHRAIHKLTQG